MSISYSVSLLIDIMRDTPMTLSEILIELNQGATPSTSPGRTLKLVYAEECENKTVAIIKEKEIQRMKSRKCIERLIYLKNIVSTLIYYTTSCQRRAVTNMKRYIQNKSLIIWKIKKGFSF